MTTNSCLVSGQKRHLCTASNLLLYGWKARALCGTVTNIRTIKIYPNPTPLQHSAVNCGNLENVLPNDTSSEGHFWHCHDLQPSAVRNCEKDNTQTSSSREGKISSGNPWSKYVYLLLFIWGLHLPSPVARARQGPYKQGWHCFQKKISTSQILLYF